MANEDELLRLLNQTKEHNMNTPRLTEAEYAALHDPNEVALEAIPDGDRPDRATLNRYVREVGNDGAPMLPTPWSFKSGSIFVTPRWQELSRVSGH